MVDNGWRPTTLGNEVEILTGFPFKSTGYTDESDGVRLLRGDNIIQGKLRWDGVKRWSASEVQDVSDYSLAAGDVVLAMDRPWIEAGLKYAALTEDDLPCLLVQRVARLRAKEALDQRFLKYVIGSPQFTNHVLSVQTGTAVPHISGSQIREYQFICPPLEEQSLIANVLGTLDEKIDLIRRMNETLEAIARALFKSWFVDFDPVRARAAGRTSEGMDAETATLFPNGFEGSELGGIPKGWRVGKLTDLTFFSRDGLNPSEYPTEIFNHYSIPAFDEGRIPKREAGSQIKSNKFFVQPGSVLLSKLNPQFPRVWLPYLNSDLRSICSTEFLVALPLAEATREFLYSLFNSRPFIETLATMVTGTSNSHQRAKAEHVLNIDVVIPDEKCVSKFTEITKPIFDSAFANLEQSQTLAAIRDALLPKLMSGEIRMKP